MCATLARVLRTTLLQSKPFIAKEPIYLRKITKRFIQDHSEETLARLTAEARRRSSCGITPRKPFQKLVSGIEGEAGVRRPVQRKSGGLESRGRFFRDDFPTAHRVPSAICRRDKGSGRIGFLAGAVGQRAAVCPDRKRFQFTAKRPEDTEAEDFRRCLPGAGNYSRAATDEQWDVMFFVRVSQK